MLYRRFCTSRLRYDAPVIAALGVMLTLADARGAEVITGYELYQKCSAPADSVIGSMDNLTCGTFIAGYLSGLYEASRVSGVPGLGIGACPPVDLAMGQYALIFRRWAAARPQSLAEPAYDALGAAIVQAYPCARR